jgi:ABC-2 type transport system ATP-binding protein
LIKIRGFTKRYDDFTAVDNLDLDVEQGDIFGFIGPNGAGKTTTIRFLATLLEPTRGEAWINGHSVRRETDAVKHSLGFMPDHFGVYDGMRVWEFLDFFALAYGIPERKRRTLIEQVLALVDLTAKREAPAAALSRGMRQRLCLAKTLVHDPPVLILDEPASGLDPRARVELKALLRELRKMGKTILISSHILPELADLCNKIGIIERGKLLAAGPVDEVTRSIRQHRVVEIKTHGFSETCEILLAHHERVRNLNAAGGEYKFEFVGNDEELAGLHRMLILENVPLLWFGEVEADLEEVFMKITKGEAG